ncbi:hypothetical protein F4678DRAFT_212019 [Xylaria arbuscula]|nr:hypothetical protein F4678DRAFT_212019 [Xylaria arbuscula]
MLANNLLTPYDNISVLVSFYQTIHMKLKLKLNSCKKVAVVPPATTQPSQPPNTTTTIPVYLMDWGLARPTVAMDLVLLVEYHATNSLFMTEEIYLRCGREYCYHRLHMPMRNMKVAKVVHVDLCYPSCCSFRLTHELSRFVSNTTDKGYTVTYLFHLHDVDLLADSHWRLRSHLFCFNVSFTSAPALGSAGTHLPVLGIMFTILACLPICTESKYLV